MTQKIIRRMGIIATALTAAFGAALSPASAASGPAISFFRTAIPTIGSTLSDSSNQPLLSITDGWKVYDPSGVCSASTGLYNSSGYTTIWTFSGSSSTPKAAGKYRGQVTIGNYASLDTSATNCLGNNSSGSGSMWVNMEQQGAATYGAGWSSGACTCWSGGSIMHSSQVGASANYGFSGQMVSLVSDMATSRGSVSLYIDGAFQKTVSLYTAGAPVNRVVVWNSPFLKSSSHVLTVKVASGRVDVDAFLTQY